MPPLFFEQAGKEIRKKTGKLPPWRKKRRKQRKGQVEHARASGRVFHAKTALEPALASDLIRAEDLNLKGMALRSGTS
jgi:hypothetical protein